MPVRIYQPKPWRSFLQKLWASFAFFIKKLFVVALAAALIWYFFFKNDAVKLGQGIKAPGAPEQINRIKMKSFRFKEYFITPLAKFHVKAKVLSKKNYHWGREADLSPVDLALGWGRMSDENVLKRIKVSQGHRWYHWRSSSLPIPRREIETCSANMHLIPANEFVEDAIKQCRKGEIVEFRGFLVRVDGTDGWHWKSSLTRKDRGAHACELVWVEKFDITSRKQL